MMFYSGWTSPYNLLRYEFTASREEGRLVPEELMRRFDALDPNAPWSEDVQRLAGEMETLPMRLDWPYEEPDELDAIRALRPDGPRQLKLVLTEDELLERYHHAWLGRAVGCALGQPVENWKRGDIKEYLQKYNAWELDDFIPFSEKIPSRTQKSCRHFVNCMIPDDDIHYTIIGLRVMEKHGRNFQWHDIADTWNSLLPYNAICTAETQAICNYNYIRPRARKPEDLSPAFTRRNNNPYRQWIGAAIRADFWGYAACGNPELAAEFAYRDACWTHSKNGIYAEMFTAAVIAAAFVVDDVEELIRIGLSEIPENCRFAEACRRSLAWYKEGISWEAFMEKLDAEYAGLHPVHAINNLQIVLMALLYGGKNIDRSTALAVMAGMDTDCNGATVGSVTGILNGTTALGKQLNDTIMPEVIGETCVTMEALAKRTLAVFRAIRQENQ